MFMTLGIVLALAPYVTDPTALELHMLANMVELPQDAEYFWELIGTYEMREGWKVRTVKLYQTDTDHYPKRAQLWASFGVGGPRMKFMTFMGSPYPNFCHIHAIYQGDDNKWRHKEIFRGARMGFNKVAEVKDEAVTLEFSSRFIMMTTLGGDKNNDIHFSEEQIREIYKPWQQRIVLKNGEPTAE
jgi:hypothetical protein